MIFEIRLNCFEGQSYVRMWEGCGKGKGNFQAKRTVKFQSSKAEEYGSSKEQKEDSL